MNVMNCPEVLDRLPELAAGSLSGARTDAVREHLAGCEDCRAEWEVVQLLAEAGPRPVPQGLEARIVGRLRAEAPSAIDDVSPVVPGRSGVTPARPRWRVPSWGLAAAAGIVLAVATPVLVERMGDNATAPMAVDEAEVTAALGDRLPSPWLDDEEGIVAGAPVLDGLSDEALEQLLEEMGG